MAGKKRKVPNEVAMLANCSTANGRYETLIETEAALGTLMRFIGVHQRP